MFSNLKSSTAKRLSMNYHKSISKIMRKLNKYKSVMRKQRLYQRISSFYNAAALLTAFVSFSGFVYSFTVVNERIIALTKQEMLGTKMVVHLM